MQDHITRARLAGEPPHVMLVPRLRSIGLMEFNRAEEAIAEGRACVEQALPTLRRYLVTAHAATATLKTNVTKTTDTVGRSGASAATGGGLIDKQAASVHNGTIMIRSARNFLAGGLLLLTLPAAHAEAALERVQFEAVLMTARDYADDRSLIFYCLRGSTETVPFLYAGLQADLEQAVQKMKSAGASARQSAEMVQMVLGTVRTYSREAKDDALDRRCISKDVERSRAEVKGVSVPLFLRPPFDKMAK